MENINVDSKSREFISILNTHFQGKVNLSRLKLIAIFVIALCKVQTVGFKKLDKQGNSNCSERIELVNRFISLFGCNCIDCLMADREFVGDNWIKFLNDNHIRYYIRIRNNFKIFIPHKNKEIKIL